MKGRLNFVSGDRDLFERYKKRHMIGEGNNMVYEVADQLGHIECVKQIRLEDRNKQFVFRKEVELLTKIKLQPHPNIVDYKGSYIITEQKGQFNLFKKGYIQMEKGITDLQKYLQVRTSPFPQEDVINFITTMINAFAHLQRSEVAHRDIKPSNIIIFSQEPPCFKICDVGVGSAVGYCDNTKEMTVIGTPYYLSPELYRAFRQKIHLINYKAYKSDTYSLGLLFLEFCTLKRVDDRLNNQAAAIQRLIGTIKCTYPNIIGLGKILRRMLEEQVANRMDFLQLQRFISDNSLLRNKIDSSLNLDPQMSCTIMQASQIRLNSLSALGQLQTLVGTGTHFDRLFIELQSPHDPAERHHLDALINIKYMELTEIHISIEMASITDSTIRILADTLHKQLHLQVLSLNFWNNQITVEGGLIHLVKVISTHRELTFLTLNFANNRLKLQLSPQKLLDFRQLIHLQKLDLNLGFNDFQSEAFPDLMRQLSSCVSLRTLILFIQTIKSNPLHLRRGFNELGVLTKLEEVIVNTSCNGLREEGMYGLGEWCEQLQNLRVLKVILRNCEVSDKGLMEFMKALGTRKKLKQLKINLLQNQITQKSMKPIGTSLEGCKQLLTFDLNLSNNKLTDVAFKHLCNSLLNTRRLVTLRLVLDSCGLTEKGCLYLGRLISEETELDDLELSLRYNEIKFEGVQFICAGLSKMKNLRRLRLVLEGTLVGDYAANYLAGCLLRLSGLKSVDLNLESCQLSSETMGNIVRTVSQYSEKTHQITVDMRRNKEVKKNLYEQIKQQLHSTKAAVKIDPIEAFLT